MVKQETSLIFYGGVNEVGGNKILLKDGDIQVFLDFGMSFAKKKQYYSPPFFSPKTEKSLQELGILPKIDGVYKFDANVSKINAVFLSHGHMDHSAYLSFLKREIPVYCGETTKIILQALSEMRRVDLEFDVGDINFKTFRTGSKIVVDNVEINPVHVDHSIPGAYGFVIYTSNASVIYTGDFRAHGAKPQMTSEFIEKAKDADPAVVITEATNIAGAHVSSETEVESKLDTIVKQTSGVVLVDFAYTDVDRVNSLYRVAKKNGRCLAVSLKQAYLLETLRNDKRLNVPNLNDDNVLIFRKSKKTESKWEKQLVERYAGKIKQAFDLSKQQCKVVLGLPFYDLEELVEIQPEAGSCYILSSSEPFNEEMEIDFERLVNWLKHFGLPQYHVHVSGHVMPLQLKLLLKEMDAAKIFPVHTESADLFAKFMRDLKSQVVLVEQGKKCTI